MKVTLIAATTSSAANVELNTNAVRSVVIQQQGLAGAEEVDIKIDGLAITDDAGTVRKLTATIPALVLEGGVVYHIDKDATAGNCSVSYSIPPFGTY